MNHKMITLCDETLKVAQSIPNFSSWVRSKLRERMHERKPNKSIPHSKCGNFVEAKWSSLDNLYWGHCEHCDEVLEWR